jgi:hypothetical protein
VAVYTRIVAAALLSAAIAAPGAEARLAPVSITFTTTPDRVSASPDATFDFTTSFPASFQCFLDGTEMPKPCSPPVVYKALGNGRHLFSVVATANDPANGQDKKSYGWTEAVPPPKTTITSAPSGTVDQATATFSFAADQPDATFSCTLDGGAAKPCTSGVSYSGLGLGSHTFTVAATTRYGTESTPATATWTIAPDTSITSGPEGQTRSKSAAFTFTSTSEGATFECSLDHGAFAACTSPQSYALEVGPHLFAVRATSDELADPTPAVRTWQILAVVPTPLHTHFTRRPQASTRKTDAVFAFVARPAPATFQCSLDGAAFAPCTSPLRLHGLSRGRHELRVRARRGDVVEAIPAAASWRILAAPFPWLPFGVGGGTGLAVLVGALGWWLRALRRRGWQRTARDEPRPATCAVPDQYVWRHHCKVKPSLASVDQLVLAHAENGGRVERELEGAVVDRLNRAARVARVLGPRRARGTVGKAAVDLAAELDRWVEQPADVEITAELTGSKAECEFTRYECVEHGGACNWEERASWKGEIELHSTAPVLTALWSPGSTRPGELAPALLAFVALVAGRRGPAPETPPVPEA